MTDLTLTTERVIKASQADLFKAWLDPDMLRRFMTPGEAVTVPSAKTDAREGGRFEIIMVSDGKELPHAGTYRKISPHERIVFTWESPYSQDDSEVTLTFKPEGEATRVTLTHVRFPSEESRDNHEKGWGAILSSLEAAMT